MGRGGRGLRNTTPAPDARPAAPAYTSVVKQDFVSRLPKSQAPSPIRHALLDTASVAAAPQTYELTPEEQMFMSSPAKPSINPLISRVQAPAAFQVPTPQPRVQRAAAQRTNTGLSPAEEAWLRSNNVVSPAKQQPVVAPVSKPIVAPVAAAPVMVAPTVQLKSLVSRDLPENNHYSNQLTVDEHAWFVGA